MAWVGIDLGCTNACIATCTQAGPEVIQNDQDGRLTPCCVSFLGTEIFYGEEGKNKLSRNAANTIVETKRLMGESFLIR